MNLPTSVDDYVNLLMAHTPYAQANYGDGEWECMLGRTGENCDGTVYDPLLGWSLLDTLVQPTGHWCGSNPGKRNQADADALIARRKIDVPWVDKEILVRANIEGRLGPWLAALRERSIVLVGPDYLAALPCTTIRLDLHIAVHRTESWRHAYQTVRQIRGAINENQVVLFAAGMGTNLMINDAWPGAWHRGITLHDIGALLDPYVGVYSRHPYRKPEFQDAMRRNLA